MRPLRDMLPHAGATVMLDSVTAWDAASILCSSRAHLDPANPLRRGGRLSAVCGLEFAMQAAAAHGALRSGGVAQRPGYVARLRDVSLAAPFLDEPGFGTLAVAARLQRDEGSGMIYDLALHAEDGTALVTATAIISVTAVAVTDVPA